MNQIETHLENDYLDYGIIPGPVHNNFDVCDSNSYVCSFEYYEKDKRLVYDLYLVTSAEEQSYVFRSSDSWDGAYGAAPIVTLFGASRVSKLHQQMLYILCGKGKFVWQKT